MHGSHLMGFIPTRDAEMSRDFYERVLELTFVSDDPFAMVFKSGPTFIRLAKMGAFVPAAYTILGWRVEDIAREVASLIGHGVQFKRYPPLEQDDLGIWTAPGGTRIAWFSDPDGNVLSLSEHPEGD